MSSNRTSIRHVLAALVAASVAVCALAPSAVAYKFKDHDGRCPDGITWKDEDLPVPYYINETNYTKLSLAEVEAAVTTAFARWENVCCAYFRGQYKGTTTQSVTYGGTTNGTPDYVIDWEEEQWPQALSGAAAVTLRAYEDCRNVHVDLLYNGVGLDWNTSGTVKPSNLDVEAVAAHEIGHIAGLGHSKLKAATMYRTANSVDQRTLHQDDKDGICFLYPVQETCNGKDDNCNGKVDEGDLTQACAMSEEGVCVNDRVACVSGEYPSCGAQQYGELYETEETLCDTKDNDCDGEIDEGLTQKCALQQGVCEGATIECETGEYGECEPYHYGEDYEQEESTCDGKDNDCDGQVDEMTEQTFWRDTDGDGYGNPGESTMGCPPGPDEYVDNQEDCAPSNPDQPGADGSCKPGSGGSGDAGSLGDVSSEESAVIIDSGAQSGGCGGCASASGSRRLPVGWLVFALLALGGLRTRYFSSSTDSMVSNSESK